MTEDAVEDDADAALPGSCDEAAKILDIAKHGIDLVIIPRIIVMIALGLKDGVEVNARDPKILQVVQFFGNPAQIPAEEVIGNNLLRIGVLDVHRVIRPVRADDCALLPYNCVSGTCKTIGEDLVHHGILEPVGRPCALVVNRNLVGCGRRIAQHADAAKHLLVVPVKIGAALCRDNEVVPEQTSVVRQIDPAGVEVLLPLRVPCLERNQALPRLVLPEAHKHLADRLIGTDADTETHPAAGLRRSNNGTVVYILRVVLHLIRFQHDLSSPKINTQKPLANQMFLFEQSSPAVSWQCFPFDSHSPSMQESAPPEKSPQFSSRRRS